MGKSEEAPEVNLGTTVAQHLGNAFKLCSSKAGCNLNSHHFFNIYSLLHQISMTVELAKSRTR
jgi:hypothetical protein